MKRLRYLQLSALHALGAERSLEGEIGGALELAGGARSTEKAALGAARSNQLLDLVKSLRLDPLVQAAVLIEPRTAWHVDERLHDLPTTRQLTARICTVLGYLSVVAVVQALVAHALGTQVGPILTGMGMDAEILGSLGYLSVALLGCGLLGAFVAGTGRGMGVLFSPMVARLERGRLAAAAATMLRHGAAGDTVVALLNKANHGADDAFEGLGLRRDDADALDELATYFKETAIARADRSAAWIKIVLSTALVVIALMLVASIYVVLPGLSGGVL